MRGAVGYLPITTTPPTGGQAMADKADQALKLAQKLEKDLKALEKKFDDAHNRQEQKFVDAHNDQNKVIHEMDKKYAEAHNAQDKRISSVVAWAEKSFDTKGLF